MKCYSSKCGCLSKCVSALWQTGDLSTQSRCTLPLAQWEMGAAPCKLPQDGWINICSCYVWWSRSTISHKCKWLTLNHVHHPMVEKVSSLPSAAARSWASPSTCPTWSWQKTPRSRSLWAARRSHEGSPPSCCPLPWSCTISKVTPCYVAPHCHMKVSLPWR